MAVASVFTRCSPTELGFVAVPSAGALAQRHPTPTGQLSSPPPLGEGRGHRGGERSNLSRPPTTTPINPSDPFSRPSLCRSLLTPRLRVRSSFFSFFLPAPLCALCALCGSTPFLPSRLFPLVSSLRRSILLRVSAFNRPLSAALCASAPLRLCSDRPPPTPAPALSSGRARGARGRRASRTAAARRR